MDELLVKYATMMCMPGFGTQRETFIANMHSGHPQKKKKNYIYIFTSLPNLYLIIKQIGFLVVRHGIFQKSPSISENSTRSPVLSKNESFFRILHKNPCVFLKSTRSPDLSHTRTVILHFSKTPLIF
jgi:hypothetical protein